MYINYYGLLHPHFTYFTYVDNLPLYIACNQRSIFFQELLQFHVTGVF